MKRIAPQGIDSFTKDVETLFLTLGWIVIISSTLVLIPSFINGIATEIYLNIAFTLTGIFCLFLFKIGYRKLVYHMILIVYLMMFNYPIAQGTIYFAFLQMYPLAIIFCMVFFTDRRIWIFYFLFIMANEAFTIHYLTQNTSSSFFPEIMNIYAMNLVLFILSTYFISNIKKYRKRLDRSIVEVNNQKDQLVKKNELLGDYIQSNSQLESYSEFAAHELKSPLRTIGSFTSLLKRKITSKLTDEESVIMDTISDGMNKMGHLIGELQKLSTISNTKLSLKENSIPELIQEIKMDRYHEIKASQAKIELDNELPFVNGHGPLLKQLLSNLIGNGLKFKRPENPPKIYIKVFPTSDYDEIWVEDNGIGIKKENQKKVFGAFYRTQQSDRIEGTGIGLAVCKKIVELHHGTIWISDKESPGTRFVIRLPKKIE